MSQLMENAYDIKELYVVKLKENYKDYLPKLHNHSDGKDVEYFNPNLYYIVEKFKIDNKNNGFHEFYTECIIGRCFFERVIEEKEEGVPDIFLEMYKFPIDYLNNREKVERKIYTSRIFQIFQQINCNQMMCENKDTNQDKRLSLIKG